MMPCDRGAEVCSSVKGRWGEGQRSRGGRLEEEGETLSEPGEMGHARAEDRARGAGGQAQDHAMLCSQEKELGAITMAVVVGKTDIGS